MRLKVLSPSSCAHRVVGVMNCNSCEAEDFLVNGEKSTEASRRGLAVMIEAVAAEGLDNMPSSRCHEVDKKNGIYEFIKGDLRLFFFKGVNGDVAVCTAGVVKKGRKADKGAVERAARIKKDYQAAVKSNSIQYICEDDENEQ